MEAMKCKGGGGGGGGGAGAGKEEEEEEEEEEEWLNRLKHGGALPFRELHKCRHGWSSPHGNLFQVRSSTYMESKKKTSGGEPLLRAIAFDWIHSSTKIFNIMKHPHGRVRAALQERIRRKMMMKKKHGPFFMAINLQVPSKDNHSLVFYYASSGPLSCCRQSSYDDNGGGHTLLQRFLDDDDSFRNTRFKLLANVVQGPWLVKAAVGERGGGACLLGKAVTCHYTREIDVDIGASMVANAIVHLAFASVTRLTVDLAFVLEGQSPDELPERILGTIRFANLDPASATCLDSPPLNASALPPNKFWRSFGSLLHSGHQDHPVANVEEEHSHACQDQDYGDGGANASSKQ